MVGLQRCPKVAQPIAGCDVHRAAFNLCLAVKSSGSDINRTYSPTLGEGKKEKKKSSPFHLTSFCARNFFFRMVSAHLVFERAPPAAEQERKQLSRLCKIVVGWLADAQDLKNLSEETRHRLHSACCISPLGTWCISPPGTWCISPPGSPQPQGLTPLCTPSGTSYERSDDADSSAILFR